jgi:hypothetical protein
VSQDENRELSAIYRAGAREEPPQWLDQRIRLAASGVSRRSAAHRFLDALYGPQLPLGLAAVMVLTVSLLLMMQADDPVWRVGEGAPDTHQAGVRSHPEAWRSSELSYERSQPSPMQDDPIHERARPSKSASGTAGASGQRVPVPGDAPQRSPQAAHQYAGARSSSEAPATRQAETSRQQEPSSGTALPSAPSLPGAQQVPPTGSAGDNHAAVPALSGRVSSSEKKEKSMAESRVSPAEPSADAHGFEDDPEGWLRRLVELSHQGHEQDVREGLRQFGARYPHHVVPEALRRFR